MPMLRPDNIFQSFGIIIVLLASIGVISLTSKFIFGAVKLRATNPPNDIYDPDHGQNMTRICPFSASPYTLPFNRTECFNRTLHFIRVPWLHFDVWRTFRERNEEERLRKLLRELEMIRLAEKIEREAAEAAAAATTADGGGGEETTAAGDTPVNRKVKEEPSKVVCTILAALLVVSSVVAICEVVRDKCLAKSPTAGKPPHSRGSASLDTGISRQEAFQSTAKVTQTLVHQTSVDRAFSILNAEVKPPIIRRSSVPVHMLLGARSGRMGCDVTSGYSSTPTDSPEMRRKSRHFIRRH